MNSKSRVIPMPAGLISKMLWLLDTEVGMHRLALQKREIFLETTDDREKRISLLTVYGIRVDYRL